MGRTVRAAKLWKSVFDKEMTLMRVPKINDLFYRLLLGVLECGPGLSWLPEEAQRCPLDGEWQTVEHL